MKVLTVPIRRLLLQLLLLLCCYSVSRCCFTLLNAAYFKGLTAGEYLRLAFYGLRFDIAAILMVNSLYIFLWLFPLPLGRLHRWQKVLQLLFVITNVLALLFDFSDWAYFPYNFKRATGDVLYLILRKGDFLDLLPQFLLDYWYVPLAAVLFVLFFVWINKRICARTPVKEQPYSKQFFSGQLLGLLLIAGLSLLGIRGGWQYVPIGIRNAMQVTESRYAPVVLNTPFSIITSLANDRLPELHYFPAEELHRYIDTRKQYRRGPFRPQNVVVIVLESFSKEFTGLGGLQSYTPFLDSLMQQAMVCTNAYANALRSADGIPAILAGIPAMQEEPFPTSQYSTNRITALPNTLKEKGYHSAFYHGGTNGTMSFDVFAAAAGFDQYKGRDEYDNEADYDGNWGIWDEPFLQYVIRDIEDTLPEPFMASVFTLSSHPPYKIPAQYKGKFPQGSLDMHACVGYTDMALRRFFESAAKQDWYQRTLFVITADHCSPVSVNEHGNTQHGIYAIPIIYYAPGDSMLKGTCSRWTQQMDILPSVLDYLGYEAPFFAFGNSIFDPAARPFIVEQQSGNFNWISDSLLLRTSGIVPQRSYNLVLDPDCKNDLLPFRPQEAEQQLQYLKAFMQVYNSSLLNNTMWIK